MAQPEKQDPLFPKGTLPEQTPLTLPPLTGDSSLKAALGQFEQHMQDEGFAQNTIKAFASDIRLLGKYLGIGQPINEVGTKNLNDFLHWLLYDRDVPCSPKSYARRVTSIKVFFGWLQKSGVLVLDPAAAVIQSSVTSPLPHIPTEEQLAQALAVTERWRKGAPRQKADARPHLLLTLLLQTGIKKGEAMAIVPNHIDRSNPGDPFLFIRYKNPRLRVKERKVGLEPEWLKVLDEYTRQYEPTDTLFTCTARNLEYILTDVGMACGLEQGLLSFENLRWASALADSKRGTEPDEIRQRLGLSKITWRETKKKLDRLKELHQGE
ncbi:MAG: phage integrase N-terminal SAM-like domain-containing protein [Anaerolineae bacterium]|nr:phage integrase N-terminal SAM-like domain-containing protein [Anaerolineae bacterium]